jgi:ATPase subunit of ABC transporter with duplicated ATPase domains
MDIYAHNKRKLKPSSFPAFVLEYDNWNDYSTKCQFFLRYYSVDRVEHEIGVIKILHKEDTTTVLKACFEYIGEEYISLGQDIAFYEDLLAACGSEVTEKFLESMRDISWQPRLAEPFETLSTFRNALLRFNSAQRARRFGQAIINGEEISSDFSFSYSTKIPGAENETKVDFDFNAKDEVPGRIFGIIGRNASGKTRFLAKLAEDLVNIRRTSLKKETEREESFTPRRPIFNRLLALSFSAFDQFSRPESEQVSYIYCGIRNKKGALSKRNLDERYRANLNRIRESDRGYDWKIFISQILGETSADVENDLFDSINSDSQTLSKLSSGQAILAHTITALVAWIEPDSIVLFDEPETHLHPNAVASLFNAFNDILDKFQSYAVIATHSPLVIQEIPGKRVVLFDRENNKTVAKSIGIETFGENLSELSRHVFDTAEIPSYYKKTLLELSEFRNFEEVMAMFKNNLSMSAQSYLMSLHMEDDYEVDE